MLGQDLADIMYGTRDASTLRQLLKRYNVDLIDIRASKYDTLTLKAYFGLAKTVSQAPLSKSQISAVSHTDGVEPPLDTIGRGPP